MEKNNRVKAVISLDAVEQNFREMRKNIAEDTKMIAVVKADAYGHGAVPIAHLIENLIISGDLRLQQGRRGCSSSSGRYYKTNSDSWNCI